jgi:hypothetical protein
MLLGACDGANRETLARSDQSPVTSCDWESVDELRQFGLSHVDETDICNTMQSALGRPPTTALFRKLSQLVTIIQIAWNPDSAKDLAYQTMNVMETRWQLQNDTAMDGSLEVIQTIFSGSEGHVTPKDLNIYLRRDGDASLTLNDDGLLRAGAVIWATKRADGG